MAGRVRGFVDKDLMVFRGIRYGADTAPRRFMPPAAPQAWRGVVETREFGAASPLARELQRSGYGKVTWRF